MLALDPTMGSELPDKSRHKLVQRSITARWSWSRPTVSSVRTIITVG